MSNLEAQQLADKNDLESEMATLKDDRSSLEEEKSNLEAPKLVE